MGEPWELRAGYDGCQMPSQSATPVLLGYCLFGAGAHKLRVTEDTLRLQWGSRTAI